MTPRTVLWHFPELPSMERCTLVENVSHKRLEGTVLTLVDGESAEIRYTLTNDEDWRTQSCVVTIVTASTNRLIELTVSEQRRWTANGSHLDTLDGVAFADLGFSPCTNTLPIRGLALEVGKPQRIQVAWLRFPELDVVRSEQVYARLARNLFRFETGTGDFAAEIEVDDHGIVTRYGDLWRELRPRNGFDE